MQKIILSGCNGYMGRTIASLCQESGECTVTAGFDLTASQDGAFPVFSDPMDFTGEADAVVDFSHPSFLTKLLSFCVRRKLPLVLCTTGYSEEQLEEIRRAAEEIPIFRSANMSLGVNVMMELARQASVLLGEEWDIEIVERHHRRKVDAPSGTALMLADAIRDALPRQTHYVYERQSSRKPREGSEIGISALRGGTIAGDHEILFAGENEVLELRHSAQSRTVFAAGALRAARYMSGKTKPGFYNMQELVASLLGR